jgi:hypothetical protein
MFIGLSNKRIGKKFTSVFSNLRHHKILLSYAAIQLIIYSPYITKLNLQNDDFNYFVPEKTFSAIHPQFQFLVLLGRPITATIIGIQNLFISDVAALNVVRIASIALISLIGKMIYDWLRIHKFGNLAYMSALLVILLPGFSFMVNLTIASAFILPVLICLYIVKNEWTKDFPQSQLMKIPDFRFNYFLLFICSLCIYQPTTMFFVPLVMIPLLLSTPVDLPKHIQKTLIVGFNFSIASFFYFILFKLLLVFYLEEKWAEAANTLYSINNGMYRLDLNFNLLSKVVEFSEGIIPNGLNLWNIYGTRAYLYITVILVICAIFKVGLINMWEMKQYFAGKLLITFGCLVASNLPNIIASGGYIANRTLLSFQVTMVFLICLLCVFLLQNAPSFLWRTIRSFLLLLVLSVLGIAFANSYTTAINNEIQVKYTRHALENMSQGIVDFKPADTSKSYLNLKSINDEFNFNSSAYYFLIHIASSDPWLGETIGPFKFNFSGEKLDARSIIDLNKIDEFHQESSFESFLNRLLKCFAGGSNSH